MNKKQFPVVSIILFVFAGILLIFSVWAAINSFQYISEMVAMGQLMTDGNEFEIIGFHMSNFGQYIVYTLLLFGMGWILLTLAPEEEDVFVEEVDVVDEFEDLAEED